MKMSFKEYFLKLSSYTVVILILIFTIDGYKRNSNKQSAVEARRARELEERIYESLEPEVKADLARIARESEESYARQLRILEAQREAEKRAAVVETLRCNRILVQPAGDGSGGIVCFYKCSDGYTYPDTKICDVYVELECNYDRSICKRTR